MVLRRRGDHAARPYRDRAAAGRRLAEALDGRHFEDPIVLALPRGGVPVGAIVADHIGAPLDVWVVRKVGAPGHREFALGALGQDGEVVWGGHDPEMFGVDTGALERVIDEERDELARRVERYRGDRPPVALQGRDVLVVDDGMATGSSAIAALESIRRNGPGRLVMVTPTAPADTIERVAEVCDEVICPLVPADFRAVGQWYLDFSEVSDREVIDLLGR